MDNILKTYPVFESNQVLTSSQLNSQVNYLDQQNRLTRAKLIGMGVVCGLEVSYDPDEDELTISKGTGITSEGYLIYIGDCTTVKYRPYELPPGTIYEPFVNALNVQDVGLFELVTDEVDDTPETELLDDEVFLDDKVVLLFIESFDKDLKSCLGKNCDELGKERILTIRKLLISIVDLEKVWSRTNTGKLDAEFPEKYDLPVINLPRALFDPNEAHSTDYTEFSKNYVKPVLDVIDPLVDALNKTYDIYRPLLLESYDEKNPFTEEPITGNITTVLNFIEDTDPTFTSYLGIQYVYDLFLDLILAYKEFKKTAFDLMSECCPDMTRFPKHLMIGKALGEDETICEKSEYIHYFVQPPIYNGQKLKLKTTVAQHNRMVLMLESFNLEKINGIISDGDGDGGDTEPLRITPSFEKRSLLSQRSIPWYYNVNQASVYTNLGNLKDYWNYDISRTCPDEEDGLLLSYEDQDNDQSEALNKLTTPFYYDIQDYSFFRIEGYINRSFDDALTQINDIKKQFNLPFDTVALQLDENGDSLELDYRCGFEDIQEEYRMMVASLCGIIDDIVQIYKFIEENQDEIFEDDNRDILEKIKEWPQMLNDICETMKDCVDSFDFNAFQKAYKTLIVRIIDLILVDQEALDGIKIDSKDAEKEIPLINGIMQRLFPLGYKILDLFFYNKFLRIYYSFKRREYFLQKNTDVFAKYLEKHPGIDHQAGVRKGGTFVMVYKDSEENNVFADFNLPYLCCGTDNCVPMCEDDGFIFDYPPFARPDYGITAIDLPVDIDVLINDYQSLGADLIIESDEESKFGGVIGQQSEKGPLTYKPKNGFMGYDTFKYILTDKTTGNSDEATVTILVKEERKKEPKGCYSISILDCWEEKAQSNPDINDRLKRALEARGISSGSGGNMSQLLLDDLRKTSGFNNDELGGGVLEEEEDRRDLLDCLGIPNDLNTKYDELGRLIVEYQKENCPNVGRREGVIVIPGSLANSDILKVLEARGVIANARDPRSKLEELYSASSGGNIMTEPELLLLTKASITKILTEKNILFSRRDNKGALVNRLLK